MVRIKFKIIAAVCIVAFFLISMSCAQRQVLSPGSIQTGLASWYGPDFHGKTTSSREIYNMYDMTAAHRTLPFGTRVMVTNIRNEKSVLVRINDRGPFIKGRIIDLSYAAAEMLDMVEEGVIQVKIEVLWDLSPKKQEQKFSVQVGSFVRKENADALKKKLERNYQDVYITLFETSSQTYFRVRIKAASRESAQDTARRLIRDGYKVFIIEDQFP